MSPNGSVEHPLYAKVLQNDKTATPLYMITVDEGWRESILCNDMYGWAANWLLEVLKDRPPFAPKVRP